MKPIRLFTVALLLAGCALAGGVEFSPEGAQSDIRQARASFSAPMVPLGRADAPAPFEVGCDVPGNGYWADERTWVYDLHAGLQAGQGCRFRLKAGLAALDGERVEGREAYRFAAAGPRVLWSLPVANTTVDEEQAFVLVLNGPVRADTLAGHVRCEVQGIYEQLPAVRLTGAERTRILAQLADELAGQEGGDRLEVLRCGRPLPAEARLALVWGMGTATPSGQVNPTDQRLEFTVRPQFAAQVRCERENARAGCNPLLPVRLEFTAPVEQASLAKLRLRDARGKAYPQARAEPAPYVDGLTFPGPFPPGARLSLGLPPDLRDDRGRALVNAGRFPMRVEIGGPPPLLKFAGEFGILERHAGGLLPLTLRNLEPGKGGTAAKVRWIRLTEDQAILHWRQRQRAFESPPSLSPLGNPPPDPRGLRLLAEDTPGLVERPLPKPGGGQVFEVVGVPLKRPGFYVVEAESRRLGEALLGEPRPMYVRTTALVTNLAVHFKWGPAASLAWVTRLDRGRPVQGAAVSVRDCRGRLLGQGRTDAQGLARFSDGLPSPQAQPYDCPLYVAARHGDDLAFALSDWEDGIETWRFGLPADYGEDEHLAHSVLDRSLFRPGETVHMRHFLRDRRVAGLGYPARLPRTLLIEHVGSGQRFFLPLNWKKGAAAGDWRIPPAARRGEYLLRLLDKEIGPDTPSMQTEYLPGPASGRFVVGDFRVPLMRATLDPVQPRWVAADTAEFDLTAAYLGGGAARNLPVKLRARLEPRWQVEFADYPDYAFARRQAGDGEDTGIALAGDALKLDAGGAGRGRIAGISELHRPHDLRVELEYADPNGEVQTVSRTTRWWPAAVVLGMKQDGWARAGSNIDLAFQAVDLDGRPAADVPVEVGLVSRRHYGYRVRLAGGFYGYRQEQRETPLPARCAGSTDAKGRFACKVATGEGGEVLVTAKTRDGRGRIASTGHSLWVADKTEWGFAQDNHDRIDLLPEKKQYAPGETARFQVRMPYRRAVALITVEREGVLDSRVVELTGASPVIELPVRGSWAPNVYVSAFVVRGRNDAVRPTALVDLGRPAFKLGIAGIRVGRRAHVLDVALKTDRAVYQVRDRARVQVRVRTPDGSPPPAGTEITLAAVDEGLLELAPNPSWDLLTAMMAERGYAMRTFTGQMQVTGKRHFGKKALPVGGGGGRLPTRELFDTLLFWQAAVPLDGKGEAQVEIPLNDSLTAFRIVAVAASETRFGTGSASIRSTQDLQLLSGLAPMLREGDKLPAYFTVRNGSERRMRVEVDGRSDAFKANLPARTLDLAPGEGREIGWPVTVPEGIADIEWRLEAREAGGKARDALKVKQTVRPAVPVRLQSAALYRLSDTLDLAVAAPDGALPGRGELRATLAASLADGQTGLRDYLRQYPYNCLEQRLSRAVALGDDAAWQALADELPALLDERGFARFFPGSGTGSLPLTAYVLSLADEAGRKLPADARKRMQQALEDYVAGRLEIPPAPWEGPFGPVVRRLAALEALARAGRATPALVATVKPEPELWPASAVIDWLGVLQRTPSLEGRAALLRAAEAALRARLAYTGKRLVFANEARDGLWWMLTSPDVNAVRALSATMDLPAWRDDLPRLLAGALARQDRGRWNTTTANVWGSLALERYARRFEATKPSGRSDILLGSAGRYVDWKTTPRGATAHLPLPARPDTLRLEHRGQGAPYVTVSTLAAVPSKEAVQRGYGISRKLIPVERKDPHAWSRGDILRIRLEIEARDDLGWVVVEDPIPAGASILGSGLQRDSALLFAGGAGGDGAWPAWQERLFDVFRAYYEYVPRGRFSLEYTLRLNSDGLFSLPPTRVEAMYAPEVHGELPNAPLEVRP